MFPSKDVHRPKDLACDKAGDEKKKKPGGQARQNRQKLKAFPLLPRPHPLGV